MTSGWRTIWGTKGSMWSTSITCAPICLSPNFYSQGKTTACDGRRLRRRHSFPLSRAHHLHEPCAFSNPDCLVGLHVFERIHVAARPADLDQVGLGGRARTEVQPPIVLRDIASAAPDLVDLRVAAGHHADARPDFEKNRRRTGVTTTDANSVSRTNK